MTIASTRCTRARWPLSCRPIRAATNPILLRVETQSGHGGGDEVKKTIDYATDIWGFLIDELGAKPPDGSHLSPCFIDN